MRFFFLLFALVFLSGPAWAQSYPSINLADGVLSWSWTTNGDPLGGFHVSCVNIEPGGMDPVVKDVTTPTTRAILLSLIPVIAGTWSCTIDAYNDTEISAESPAVIFRAQYCVFR